MPKSPNDRRPPRRRSLKRNPLAWFLAVASGLAVLVLVVAIGNTGAGGASNPNSGSTNGGGGASGRAGITLVAYQGADLLGGNSVLLGSLLGKGMPVVVNFFAGQCPPCRAEMPGFADVYERHRAEILIVGADIGPFVGLGSHDDARGLLRDLGISYPAGYVVDNPVSEMRITGMPTTIVYDARGQVALRRSGFLTEGELEQIVERLISASS